MATTDDPLEDVLKAITTAWTANSATLTAINGPYLHEKPANLSVGFPYAVIKPERSIPDRWTCENQFWDNGLTVWLYDNTAEKAAGHANTVRSIFDDEGLSLSLSNGSVVRKRSEVAESEQLDEHVFRHGVGISLYTRRPRTKA